MNEDLINLVDESGTRIGTVEKFEAHKTGVLHEAFSIFVFNKNKELLLQSRNLLKYHSGGLWSNTCCSHARVGEELEIATHRRLQEEMGIDCDLKKLFTFTYKVPLENGLIEHEFDHVFIGYFDDMPNINPEEASEFKWIDLETLKNDVETNPDLYTAWLKIIINNPDFLNNVK